MSESNRIRGGLWRDRAFVLFWLGRTVSSAGSTVTTVVLPILVYQLTGSALLTGLLAALEVVPYIVFGLLAGALADRTDRRRVMIGADLLNALALGSIPIAHALGSLTIAHIYIVALLSAVLFVWFDAANFGALPALVGRSRILEANSLIGSAAMVISILGPALGGLLAATLGAAPAIAIDAVSYALSAVSLALIPRAFTRANAPTGANDAPLRSLGREIREGLHFLWQHRLVRTLTLLGFGMSVTAGGISGLLVVYAVRGLELAATDARIGLLFTAGGVGALAATLLLPWLVRRVPVGRITLYGLFLQPLLQLAVALAPELYTALLCYGLWVAINTLVTINGISLRQMVIPDHLQGRVNATARMIAWGGTPFGAAIGGVLAELMPVRSALIVLIVFVSISAILGWFSPLPQAQTPKSDMSAEQA